MFFKVESVNFFLLKDGAADYIIYIQEQHFRYIVWFKFNANFNLVQT